MVLDPITQPLSWALESALHIFTATPWWVVLPLMLALVWVASRSWALMGFVGSALGFLLFVDHYTFAMQTMSIIFVCAGAGRFGVAWHPQSGTRRRVNAAASVPRH